MDYLNTSRGADSANHDSSHLLSISTPDISSDVFLSISLRLQFSISDSPLFYELYERCDLLRKMPLFSQEELDEILGVGYETRVFESPRPPPKPRRLISSSRANVRATPASDHGETARKPSTVSPKASHTSRVMAFNLHRPSSPTSRAMAVVVQTSPTTTSQTPLLALSFDEPTPRNKWTEEQRSTLAFMRRTFDNNSEEHMKIFNTMFADDLRACGLKNGITNTTLDSQWRDMKAGKKGYEYWTLFNINFNHWNQPLTDLQERVQNAAKQNDIIPNIRVLEENNIRKHGHRQKRIKNAIRPHGLTPYLQDSSGSDKGMFPNTETVVRVEEPRVRPLVTSDQEQLLPETSSSPLYGSDDTMEPESTAPLSRRPRIPPRLAYRFFNLSSAGSNGRQFICGALTEGAPMPAPEPDSEEFKMAFTRHMIPEMFPSPFISCFASCLPPIHRAMVNRNAAGVAVIDLAGLVHDSKNGNGEKHQCVFSAGDLVAKYGLSLRGNYKAPTEYHVYGTIPSKYVVCLFSTDSLLDIAKSFPEIDTALCLSRIASTHGKGLAYLKRWFQQHSATYNEDSGRLVGRLLGLLDAPQNIVVDLSFNIAEAWRFRGCRRHRKTLSNEGDREYLSGVTSGYGSVSGRILVSDGGPEGNMHVPTNDIVPNSQNTQQTIPQDEDFDAFNPFDVDMDGAASDVSQTTNMKVQPWLASLQDAARESDEDGQMDIDRLDMTDHGPGRGALGGAGNIDERGTQQSSPLERMAARKGLTFHRPPKLHSGID